MTAAPRRVRPRPGPAGARRRCATGAPRERHGQDLARALARLVLAAALASGGLAGSAAAQEVRIGYAAAVTSADPHFHALASNLAVHRHVYESLVRLDERLRPEPELATSWRALDPTTWEFSLRATARWHDGTPFTGEDVVFSAGRVTAVPGSPQRYTAATRGISAFEIAGPYTLRVRTERPNALLPQQLSDLLIVPRAIGDAGPTDFAAGRAAVGTGPYRFRGWEPGYRFELERNEAYDGPAEPWRRVTFLLIPNAAARLAALRTGAVQLIDQVPTGEVAALSRDADFAVSAVPGVRNIFLFLDQAREWAPGFADPAGKPLANPLRDLRVRRALSLAVNRQGIAASVMNGQATASGQLLPEGMVGYDPGLGPDPYDPERARRLLAEAGFPAGFSVVLAGPSDRYVNDEQVLQAVAQGWTRAGLRVQVEAEPSTVYFGRVARGEFAIGMLGWGTASGEADSPLATYIATADPRKFWGSGNRSGFSNAEVDRLLAEALALPDAAEREGLYRRATRIAMDEVAVIPLHHQANVWATRRGYAYRARLDERTMATELRATAGPP